jgi:mannitol 2-dehydrogenase
LYRYSAARMTGAAEELVCAGLCSASLDEFVVWLQTEVKYPSTMVDRITPATSWEDIATLPQKVGFEDKWPVMCEPYKHWWGCPS